MRWLAWLADAAILGGYLLFTLRGMERPFHWANALGCIPLLWVEYTSGAYEVMPVTLSFGVIGWIGVIGDWTVRGTRTDSSAD